jgi:hypothetical protein
MKSDRLFFRQRQRCHTDGQIARRSRRVMYRVDVEVEEAEAVANKSGVNGPHRCQRLLEVHHAFFFGYDGHTITILHDFIEYMRLLLAQHN